jgi:nucleotide-binding universal stress UspA family protein
MTPVEIVAVLIAGGSALGLGVLVWRQRRGPLARTTRRILFPFSGTDLSRDALDAALRLAHVEHAVLVPAYLAPVPRTLPLDAPIPNQCETAIPLLDTIEQRAARAHVEVDSRIESGRDTRHALTRLLDEETYDRIVAVAAANGSDGFDSDDIRWLIDHAGGELVILRPSKHLPLRHGNGTLGPGTSLNITLPIEP